MTEVKRYYGLDFLKFISTIIIIFHHYQQITGLRFTNLINFYGGGFYFGWFVELFFIISGFLLAKNIHSIKKQNSDVTFSWFFIPKYLFYYTNITISIIFVIFESIICYVIHSEWFGPKINIFNIFISCLGLQNIGIFKNPGFNNPMWYVSVLIFCIILFYFLCIFSKKFNINENILFCIMIILGLYIKYQKINFLFLNNDLQRGYVAFFTGVVLYNFLYRYRLTHQNLNSEIALFITLFQLFVINLIIILTIIDTKKVIINQYYVFTIIFFPTLVTFFTRDDINTILNIPFIAFFGQLIFPMFLWHVFWINLISRILKLEPSFTNMLLTLLLDIVFSIFYSKLIAEKIKKIINNYFSIKKQI